MRSSRLGRLSTLPLLMIPIGVVMSTTQASAFYSCDPGYVYQVNNHTYTFQYSNQGTYTVYNATPNWNVESFTSGVNQTFTVNWQLSYSGGVSATVYIIGIQSSSGMTVGTSTTKGTGWSLSASVNTPPWRHAHFQTGAFGQNTNGAVYWTDQNCGRTWQFNENFANAPKPGDFGIKAWWT